MANEEASAETIDVLASPMPSKLFEMQWHRDGKIVTENLRIQVQPVSKNVQAIQDAQAYAKGKDLDGYGDVYREGQAHEILWRAVCYDKEVTRADGTRYWRPRFISADNLRDSLSETEMSTLLEFYHITKAEYGPIVGLGDFDLDEWVERLKGPMGADFLGRLDSLHWPALIFTLAGALSDLSGLLGLTPTSSPDSSESSPGSSTEDTGPSTSPPTKSNTETQKLLTPEEIEKRSAEIFSRKVRKD